MLSTFTSDERLFYVIMYNKYFLTANYCSY